MAANIERRVGHLEQLVGDADCICDKRRHAFVVVENDWTAEQLAIADASASFVCPTHGPRTPSILHVSQTDMQL
jgi:hypothetical protein